jgi:hypothetical protein
MRFIANGWGGMPSWHCYYAKPLAKHYHRPECPEAAETVPVTHEQAQARKLAPCKVCKPISV